MPPTFEIECRGITKLFGDFVAVDHVDLGVSHGEVFGFLGPNGCGKSTTIRMICGILTPTEGQAFVGGVDVLIDPERTKQQIGYMSQKFSLYDDLTVLENLQFFGGVYGLHGRKRRNRIDEVLGVTGLGDERSSLVAELSAGVRQRLALGASILHSPDILILDEPTSGVDPVSRRRFWDLINDLASDRSTILVTTHAMDEAEHCHRLAMMQGGRVVCVGAPEELRRTKVSGRILSIVCEPLFPALAIAKGLHGVTDASVLGSRLHVRLDGGELDSDRLRAALSEGGIRVASIEPATGTLEDVFVALTGEVNA